MKTSAALAVVLLLILTPAFSLSLQPYFLAFSESASSNTSQGSPTQAKPIPYKTTSEAVSSRLFELTWISRDSPGPSVVGNDSVATGDRVAMSAIFPDIPGDPNATIASITWNSTVGIYFEAFGELLVFVPNSSTTEILLEEFAWNMVDGIRRGDNVSVFLDFTNGDADAMAWWFDTDNTTWTAASNLLGTKMTTDTRPERGWFIADRSGSLMVGVRNPDAIVGNFTLTVDTRRYDSDVVLGNEVIYETWIWFDNVTLSMDFAGRSIGGETYEFSFSNLSINNFFAPRVENVTVTGETEVEFTWDIYDLNQHDEHYSQLLISGDSGVTFQLMAANLTEPRFVWDSTGFIRQIYVGKIRVFDNDPELNPNVAESGYRLGLTDEVPAFYFYGGTVGLGNYPPVPPGIVAHDDVTFEAGTSGNEIRWHVHSGYDAYYFVRMNDTRHDGGSWPVGSGYIVVDLDHLEPGIYRFHLCINARYQEYTAEDTVWVTVLPGRINQIQLTMLGLGAGFLIGFIVVVVLHTRASRTG
ncbi:MAG: hypothetical protein JSW61_10590 [Candidatus Thorarchaeota archaeon]|nr:MAG: hypothetical protein JSW61_10590 [Candidatus Thorarchaeota archaeon]